MTTQVLFPAIDAIHVSKFGHHATLSWKYHKLLFWQHVVKMMAMFNVIIATAEVYIFYM